MPVTKVCPRHLERKTVRGYCLSCKREREKSRYWADPDRERRRKKAEYAAKTSGAVKEQDRITMTQEEVCSHDLAAPLGVDELPQGTEDRAGTILGCGECGAYIDLDSGDENESLDALLGIGGTNAGKAQSPRAAGKKYRRSEEHKVTVKCRHPGCKHTFRMWKQNVDVEHGNDCPQYHRPLKKRDQARERQKNFRNRSKTH